MTVSGLKILFLGKGLFSFMEFPDNIHDFKIGTYEGERDSLFWQ